MRRLPKIIAAAVAAAALGVSLAASAPASSATPQRPATFVKAQLAEGVIHPVVGTGSKRHVAEAWCITTTGPSTAAEIGLSPCTTVSGKVNANQLWHLLKWHSAFFMCLRAHSQYCLSPFGKGPVKDGSIMYATLYDSRAAFHITVATSIIHTPGTIANFWRIRLSMLKGQYLSTDTGLKHGTGLRVGFREARARGPVTRQFPVDWALPKWHDVEVPKP